MLFKIFDHGRVPEFLTCTQRLQEWNQPRKKIDPVPVVDIKDRKQSIKGVRNSSGSRTPTKYDPRPPNLRFEDFEAVEQLRVDLLSSGRSCALTTLLVPSVEKISHDHCYVSTNVRFPKQHTTSIRLNDSTSTCVCPHSTEDFKALCNAAKGRMNVSMLERLRIEEGTRSQSASSEWYLQRSRRITGSKCARIIKQLSKTSSLLQSVLHPKPFGDLLPPPIKWGRENEGIARSRYEQHMHVHGHHDLTVRPCGFIIHPDKGWSGALPDGVVHDPIANLNTTGLLEIKCSYLWR